MATALKRRTPPRALPRSSKSKAKSPSRLPKPAPSASSVVCAWEDDPGRGADPAGAQPVEQAIPDLALAPLPTAITNPAAAPAAQIYQVGSADFRYWSAASTLRLSSNFWGGILTNVSWQVGKVLPVDLDFGDDLNAYYDREGLKFFHGAAGGRIIYSGESPDVVRHELGHAVLDSIKPQLWDAASLEVAAFHESFGDMSAILCALQLQSIRVAVLRETGNVLYRSSSLSRLAEQLGWALRQSNPALVDPDCLRNAVNSFFYRDPDTLPTQAPASALSSEPHSFSRVFTSAFFEGLAGMLRAQPAPDEQHLETASQDAATILVKAIRAASVVPSFYSQVAAQMLAVARSDFGSKGYETALRSAFVRHGILPPAMSVTVAATAAPALAAAAPEPQAAALPEQQLSVAEYGLGVATITVHAAAEPKRFDVAGAALAMGAVASPSADAAAKSFFEDLLRRGRLKLTDAPEKRAEVVRSFAPRAHDTHTHELRKEDGRIVLRRVRIDCCFCARGLCATEASAEPVPAD